MKKFILSIIAVLIFSFSFSKGEKSISKDVFITPLGGFSGFTSNFQFWPNATNPQEAYNIYKKGFGGSALGNLFNKYRIKFVFLVDNQEQGSFEI